MRSSLRSLLGVVRKRSKGNTVRDGLRPVSGSPSPCPLERRKRKNDEASDEPIALRILHCTQHFEQQEGLGKQRGARREDAFHRHKEQQRVQDTPEKQRERPRENGER